MVSYSLNRASALKKIIREEYTDKIPVPEPGGVVNYENFYNKSLEGLNELIEEYSLVNTNIKNLYKIDVPKPNFAIRPMGRPEIKEWIIYETIIDNISKKILNAEEICQRSFSIHQFKHPETPRLEPWLKFKEEEQKFYEDGYCHVVISDITGFYENISLERLRNRIIDYLDDLEYNDKFIKVLFKLLRKWSSERILEYGLPQGPNASSFLADIYLDSIDRKMEEHCGYFRYGDDIRIFCKKEIDCKIALKDFIIALRDLKLNINAKKTGIFSGKKIENKLFDQQKSLMNMIEIGLKSGNKEIIEETIPNLIWLFENSFSNHNFSSTHLKFSLYRLSLLKYNNFYFDTTKIIKIIKDNFVSNPNNTDLFCLFLSLFPNKDTLKFLIDFLESEDNIYEWQEMQILKTLLNLNVKFDHDFILYCINSANDSNKNYVIRSFYYLIAGKHGNNRDRITIQDSYNDSLDNYLKKSIILAVQELGKGSRNDFYSKIKLTSDEEIKQLIDHLKSRNQSIYYPKFNLNKIKISDYEFIFSQ